MKNLITRITLFVLNFFGVSIEDLDAYAKNQTEIRNSSKKLPLEILYKNDYRSFFFEAGKTPIAIIVGNVGFAMEDAPQLMNWHNANKYCEKYSVGGKKWKLPNKESGHLDLLYKNKEAINVVLAAFGKEPLKEAWYWSSSEYYNFGAWSMILSDGSVYDYNKNFNYHYVRPVLIF